MGFPGDTDKKSTHQAGDTGSTPGLERSPGGGNGHPLQYSRLENLMNRGAQWAVVHGVTKIRQDTETKQQPPICLAGLADPKK